MMVWIFIANQSTHLHHYTTVTAIGILNHVTTVHTSGAGTTFPSAAPEFTPGFSGVYVTRSLSLCECFVDRYLSFCPFSFGHCSSSIYGLFFKYKFLYMCVYSPMLQTNLIYLCQISNTNFGNDSILHCIQRLLQL